MTSPEQSPHTSFDLADQQTGDDVQPLGKVDKQSPGRDMVNDADSMNRHISKNAQDYIETSKILLRSIKTDTVPEGLNLSGRFTGPDIYRFGGMLAVAMKDNGYNIAIVPDNPEDESGLGQYAVYADNEALQTIEKAWNSRSQIGVFLHAMIESRDSFLHHFVESSELVEVNEIGKDLGGMLPLPVGFDDMSPNQQHALREQGVVIDDKDRMTLLKKAYMTQAALYYIDVRSFLDVGNDGLLYSSLDSWGLRREKEVYAKLANEGVLPFNAEQLLGMMQRLIESPESAPRGNQEA